MTEATVLVGVDGSPGSVRALRWAAAEAARLGVPLMICCVVAPVSGALPVLAERWSDEVLGAARKHVRAEWPQVAVQTVRGEGHATSELLRLSTGHRLVVVGARGGSGLTGHPVGPVAVHLVSHALCPIVVVPMPGVNPRAPVLVGVDGSELNRPAVEYAFAAADRAGVPVVALSSLDGGRPGTGFGHPAADIVVALARDVVREWADKLPHIPVTHRIVTGPPSRALADASARASLTVVGSRGHGGMTALLLGSVSRRLVQQAASPVVVVRQLSHCR